MQLQALLSQIRAIVGEADSTTLATFARRLLNKDGAIKVDPDDLKTTLANLLGETGNLTATQIAAFKTALGMPKIYRALLTQSGTSAPTVIVLENALSAAIVWARTGAGIYTGTLASAFTTDKTLVFSGDVLIPNRINVVRSSANVVTVTTLDEEAAAADGVLGSTPIQILVYP